MCEFYLLALQCMHFSFVFFYVSIKNIFLNIIDTLCSVICCTYIASMWTLELARCNAKLKVTSPVNLDYIYTALEIPKKVHDHYENGGLYQHKRRVTEMTHLQVGSQNTLNLS